MESRNLYNTRGVYNSSNTDDEYGYFWNDYKVSEPIQNAERVSTFSYNCCKNCPNNPANNPNASGVCHCVLPSMEMIRY